MWKWLKVFHFKSKCRFYANENNSVVTLVYNWTVCECVFSNLKQDWPIFCCCVKVSCVNVKLCPKWRTIHYWYTICVLGWSRYYIWIWTCFVTVKILHSIYYEYGLYEWNLDMLYPPCCYCNTEVGNVDPGGPVSLQSLAPTLIKHTWTS